MIELRNKSCFDFLKTVEDESVSLVLIDPPYEISKKTYFANGCGLKRLGVSMDFGEWDTDFEGLDIVIKECYRVLKQGGTLICFYDLWKISILSTYFEHAQFKQLRFIEWVKTNPVPLNSHLNYLTNAREIAVVGVKGSIPTFHSEYDNGIYMCGICREKGRFHPTQKPLTLIKKLIEKHSNEEDIVLDCFSGSGTTAVACIELNRQFRGCEINKEYFEKSIIRVKEALDLVYLV